MGSNNADWLRAYAMSTLWRRNGEPLPKPAHSGASRAKGSPSAVVVEIGSARARQSGSHNHSYSRSRRQRSQLRVVRSAPGFRNCPIGGHAPSFSRGAPMSL